MSMSLKMSEIYSKRIYTIDIMRGAAILFMIWDHFILFFSLHYAAGGPINVIIHGTLNMISPISAPLFFILSGLSITISTEKKREKKVPEAEIRSHVLKRGGLVILFGYCYSMIRVFWALSIYKVINFLFFWDLLHALGLLMILTYFSLKLSIRNRIILLCFVTTIMLTLSNLPLLFGQPQSNTLYTLWAATDYYEITPMAVHWLSQGNFGFVLLDFTAQILWAGTFPVIPWIFFSLIGSITGSLIIERKDYRSFGKHTFILGAVVLGIGILAFFLTNLTFAPLLYIDSTFYCGLTSGIVVLLFLGFLTFLDYRRKTFRVGTPVEIMGQIPLSLYVLHGVMIAILYEALNVFILIKEAFLFPLILLPVIGSCLLLGAIAYAWQLKNYKYSLDWLVKRIVR